MNQREETRLAQFEKMKESIETQFMDVKERMDQLRDAGKQKSATYMQLMANKMTLENMIQLYKIYDIE